MSDKTNIEWAEASWNPIRGQNARHTCARISPGCDNCYAATMTRRGLGGTAPIDYGTGETLNDPARLDEKALSQPSRWKAGRRIFVCSMTDLFGSWVENDWLHRIFDEMENNPQHTYLLLTKRPRRMRDYINWKWTGAYQPQFIWAGTTIEEDRYSWRANLLRETNAAVRWVSAEPLLSGLPSLDLTDIDWVVAGGESGPGARPMHPSWPRELRDRCQEASAAYFFKQHGNYVSTTDCPPETTNVGAIVAVSLDGSYVDERTLREADHGPFSVRTAPSGSVFVMRVGKHRSGRLLDGVEHNEYPSVAVPS
jgi:protein gp37